jgi:hypothetical protein
MAVFQFSCASSLTSVDRGLVVYLGRYFLQVGEQAVDVYLSIMPGKVSKWGGEGEQR